MRVGGLDTLRAYDDAVTDHDTEKADPYPAPVDHTALSGGRAAAVHGWIRRHHRRRHPSRIAESQPRRAFETGRSASGSPGTRVSGCRVDAAGDAPPKAPPTVREFTRARTSAQGAPATTTGTKVATGGGRRAAQPCRAQSQPERPGSRRRGPRVPRLPFPTGHG